MNPVLYEMHMHTPLCKHAVGEPEEYAAVAEQRGLKGIVVTCHNPTDNGWAPTTRMSLAEFDQYVALVEKARRAWQGRVDVRLGIESDYAPGMEAWLRDLHSRAEFHHVLGSVHPQLDDYRKRYFHGDYFEYQKTYFEHLAMAAESDLFDTIAHPDIVKILNPTEWHLERVMEDICSCLDRIAATGVAMELNTSGLLKIVPEMHPGEEVLREIQRRAIPVVVGADAHRPDRVAASFEQAFHILKSAGYSYTSFFLNRQRQDHAIDAMLSTLTTTTVGL